MWLGSGTPELSSTLVLGGGTPELSSTLGLGRGIPELIYIMIPYFIYKYKYFNIVTSGFYKVIKVDKSKILC